MLTNLSGTRSTTAWLAPLVIALPVSACAPQHSAPVQTQATNPSVTYKYRGDDELVAANDKAMAYCAQYRSTATTARIDSTSDGAKEVTFQCVPAPSLAGTQIYNPNHRYSYRSDEELLGVTESADQYCSNDGSQRALTTVTMDANGNKVVTFHCVPR